jgi:hypothetical protein
MFETSSSSSSSSLNTSQCSSSLKQNESFSNLDSKIKDFSYFFNKDVPLHRILYNLEVILNTLKTILS